MLWKNPFLLYYNENDLSSLQYNAILWTDSMLQIFFSLPPWSSQVWMNGELRVWAHCMNSISWMPVYDSLQQVVQQRFDQILFSCIPSESGFDMQHRTARKKKLLYHKIFVLASSRQQWLHGQVCPWPAYSWNVWGAKPTLLKSIESQYLNSGSSEL